MKNISLNHCDTLDYNPSRDGGLPTARLNFRNIPLLAEEGKDKIFQFDEHFHKFRENKELCREESINKYYQDMGYDKKGFMTYIIEILKIQNQKEFTVNLGSPVLIECHLTGETLAFAPETFAFLPQKSKTKYSNTELDYMDSFDAIAMQVPEDIILQRFRDDYQDYIGSIHLCAANDWSAERSINKSMTEVHKRVPYIGKVITNDQKLVKSITQNGRTFERTGAINFYTESFINKHPDNNIIERPIDELLKGNGTLFFRFERQTISPLEQSYFLFTIRTYFCDIKKLEKENREKLKQSFFQKAERINAFTSLSSDIKNREDEFVAWVDAIDN
jgi:hypothetical protein